MFELIKQLRIHPIQYLLVGLALAIFFLLLISLSEHIAFEWAYLSASAACIGLQGFYLIYVLRSIARGIGFAGMLTALYGALYGLLGSEDNALLLGSLMLFAILAAIMVITRKIDWYRVAQTPLAGADDAIDPASARA
jgi:inner membrane protein